MSKRLTTKEHWELHQSLWHMLGCDMELKYRDRNNVIYVDKKENIQYTYSAKGFIKWFPISKENKDEQHT